MKIGIDLGKTIVKMPEKIPFDNCFDILAYWAKYHEIFIISRVNSDQKERSLKWLKDFNFFELTGIKKDNLYYCFDRRDKSLFVKALNIELFIDDRPEVLSFMDKNVRKILFNPIHKDKIDFWGEIKEHNMELVSNWKQIKI